MSDLSAGKLFVVGTPIGNLQDFSPRALEILRQVDLIAAEDTRHTRKLLSFFDIHTPLTSYHEHNEKTKAAQLVESLLEGKSVALVSDAGTPCISDPGYRLVNAARERGIRVVAVPGPSAITAALSVCGLPTDTFTFHGFVPRKESETMKCLQSIADTGGTHVFFEAPGRLVKMLEQVEISIPDAQVAVSRELSKVHEETFWGTAAEVRRHFAETGVRGECVVVIYAECASKTPNPDVVQKAITDLMKTQGMTRSRAAREVAKRFGIPRNKVYALALSENPDDDY